MVASMSQQTQNFDTVIDTSVEAIVLNLNFSIVTSPNETLNCDITIAMVMAA